ALEKGLKAAEVCCEKTPEAGFGVAVAPVRAMKDGIVCTGIHKGDRGVGQTRQAELSHWLSPVLVLPLLQVLSCSRLTEPLADPTTHSLNHSLAQSLLDSIRKPTSKAQRVGSFKQFLKLNLVLFIRVLWSR
ncbi:hypothetical protein GOODEAATRI_016040, partial [Goodea atripinnis]